MHLKLVIQYDGADFSGSQLQAADKGRTVQGELEQALVRLTGSPIRVDLAGRTDTGVHAWGQVASFDFPARSRLDQPEVVTRALNGILPRDLAVISAEQVKPGFHARFSARSRAYRYLILNAPYARPLLRRYSLHVTRNLDLGAMREAVSMLAGTHDFASFAGHGMGVPGADADRPSTIRNILMARLVTLDPEANFWAWQAEQTISGQEGNLLAIDLVANAFLPNMIRNIVGTLLEVGGGKRTVAEFGNVLESKDRRLAGPTAGPHGLCLMWVEY
ncbi:MAG: tRNA pseudouridine(38-40) synthase TruA [Chloroflexia bacterium]